MPKKLVQCKSKCIKEWRRGKTTCAIHGRTEANFIRLLSRADDFAKDAKVQKGVKGA